jgi:hypothetical protein
MAFGPRGTPHCFQNIGDNPGRLLVITTPSGLERFFEQFAALLPGPVSPGDFGRRGPRQLGRIRWPASFHAGCQAAAFLIRAGLLVVWLQLNVYGFRPVLARSWHGRPSGLTPRL